MEPNTLADFVSKYGVRPFADNIDCVHMRAYVSPSEELLQLVFEWSSNIDCSNKYVKADGMGYSSPSYDEDTQSYLGKQFYRYEFENEEIFTVGLIGDNSDWEYLGFSNLKYGIELSFSNGKMADMKMYV